jgi:hypothetical protein
MMRLKVPTYIHINNVLNFGRNFNSKTIAAKMIRRFYIDAPLSSLLDPKRVQLCSKAEVVKTWCRSLLLALKGGKRDVLKAPGLD